MTKPVLILSRPEPGAHAFLELLPRHVVDKVDVVISPLMQITGTGAPVHLDGIAGVIFSSGNGVTYGPPGDGRPAYCVGDKTTERARSKGWHAQKAGANADQLVAALQAQRPMAPLLHLCGVHQRGDIAARLSGAGIMTDAVLVYDQSLLPLDPVAKAALSGSAPCIVPLFSPRTAAQFAKECPVSAHVVVVALSGAVAAAWGDGPVEHLLIADEPTARSMCFAVETAVNRDR